MQHDVVPGSVVPVTSLTEYFRDAVRSALDEQRTDVGEHTEHYIVDMLTRFSRTERLNESAGDGRKLKPLAQLFAEATHQFATYGRRCGAPHAVGGGGALDGSVHVDARSDVAEVLAVDG